jgi:hypothetical protein
MATVGWTRKNKTSADELLARTKSVSMRASFALGETDIFKTLEDFRFTPEMFRSLKIRNDAGRYVSFNLNPAQKKIISITNKMMDNGMLIREILLKARQFGGSTLYCAMGYILSRDFGLSGAIIGQNRGTSKHLFRMMKNFLKFEDPDIYVENNKDEIIFKNGGDIRHYTADTNDVGRGLTFQWVLMTELPKWPASRVQEILIAVYNTVADMPGTFVFIESTGRVPEDDFHNIWKEAEAGGTYKPIFIAWQDINWKYFINFSGAEERQAFADTLNSEEKRLYHDEGVTLEQLKWRRYAFKVKCKSDWNLFKCEYPSNPAEAFQFSEKSFFDGNVLDTMFARALPPIHKSEVRVYSSKTEDFDNLKFEDRRTDELLKTCFAESDNGRLWIWEWPLQGVDYEIGGDVALGVESAWHTDDSALMITRNDTGKLVASWAGKVKPDMFADLIQCVGTMYNEAYCCVEANSFGVSTLDGLWGGKYPRHRIYSPHNQRNVTGNIDDKKIGFWSSDLTKATLMNNVEEKIRKRQVEIHDKELIVQMRRLTTDVRGKIVTHGLDKLMAFAMCCEAHDWNTPWEASKTVAKSDTTFQSFMKEIRDNDRKARLDTWRSQRLAEVS